MRATDKEQRKIWEQRRSWNQVCLISNKTKDACQIS